VRALAAALTAAGREVTTWTRPGLDPPTFAAALHAAWADRPPQVAHSHFWTSGLATLAVTQRLAVPVVQTFHGLGLSVPRSPDLSTAG
jgi:hypothetical protein